MRDTLLANRASKDPIDLLIDSSASGGASSRTMSTPSRTSTLKIKAPQSEESVGDLENAVIAIGPTCRNRVCGPASSHATGVEIARHWAGNVESVAVGWG